MQLDKAEVPAEFEVRQPSSWAPKAQKTSPPWGTDGQKWKSGPPERFSVTINDLKLVETLIVRPWETVYYWRLGDPLQVWTKPWQT
jgi:hypothetical protein